MSIYAGALLVWVGLSVASRAGSQSAESNVTTVDTLGAPRILLAPLSTTVAGGAAAALRVSALGALPLSYQWLKDGVALPSATSATLSLAPARAPDSGAYSVVVRNPSGSVTSTAAHLAVLADGASGTRAAQVSVGAPIVQSGGKDTLVIVTHGWVPKELNVLPGQEPPIPPAWARLLADQILERSDANVQVVALDWALEAWRWTPDDALHVARSKGAIVGEALAKQSWKAVHLIGHSAGAALIERISKALRSAPSRPLVHETFLDPYLGAMQSKHDEYGVNAHWADCYFANDWTGSWTGRRLRYAYNVDVTWLDPGHVVAPVFCPGRAFPCGTRVYSRGLTEGHAWPHKFYSKTVTGQFACAPEVGFRLSMEAGGWDQRVGLPRDNTPNVLCPAAEAFEGAESVHIPDWTWTPLPIQDLPRGAQGNWELRGPRAFALTALPPTGSARLSAPGDSLDKADGPLADDGVAWLAMGATVTQPANYVRFDAVFASGGAAEGVLGVYWNTNQIGMLDERAEDRSVESYQFALPNVVTNGVYTLSFRLDAFNAKISSVIVTNVATGYHGFMDPPLVVLTDTGTDGIPTLKVTAPAGIECVVVESTDLLDWAPAAVLVNTNGTVYYPLPGGLSSTSRFYRVVQSE